MSSIAKDVPSVGWLLAVWGAGAVLTLVGALCYAEMATAYPRAGGDYVFLTEAFGRKIGFLFAWGQFWIVRPGSVGITALVYANYANQVVALPERLHPLLLHAVLAIVLLTGVNLLGIRAGKTTQNLLTLVKLLGLLAIVVAGMTVPAGTPAAAPPDAPLGLGGLAAALIFIFFAYSGWNEMPYVSSEIRNPQRNILWSLVLSTLVVTALYVAVNLAFVHALGLEGLRHSSAPAATVLSLTGIGIADKLISILICLTALGGMNGMIFTGARIYYAVGTDHRLFSWLGRWSSLTDTPARPLIIQAVATVTILTALVWNRHGLEGFEDSVAFTSVTFWLFLYLTSHAFFVLRARQAASQPVYRVPWYPVVPLTFCLCNAFMLFKSFDYAMATTPWGLLASMVVLAIGAGLSLWVESREKIP